MDLLQGKGTRWNNTSGEFANGSASVIRDGSTARIYYVTDISGSIGNGTAKIELRTGGTRVWQDIMDVASYRHQFRVPIATAADGSVEIKVIPTITGSAYANMAGYFIG